MKYLFLLLLSLTILAPLPGVTDVPHVNWENHPVHPLDRAPNGTLLAVAHTADHRVQLFDITGARPKSIGHIPVGVDPVSVRFRSNTELWVVNHVSDSISIVDVEARSVKATILTMDEPYDVVFAGTPERAFVSCSQANAIQVFNTNALNDTPTEIPLAAEDPRAMAVSPENDRVYVAIFESGNASTILTGRSTGETDPRAVILLPETPHDGDMPPPNMGDQFSPPIDPDLPGPPRSALIVKKDEEGRWMDDNGGDWTPWVSGENAQDSNRVEGWDIPDRDIAVINANSLQVSYVTGLMNIGMGMAVNPMSGRITMIGTDAINQMRFEPNVNGRFVQVLMASVNADQLLDVAVTDLNPHLDYAGSTIPQSQRNKSIGDPRGIVWTADGARGYVAGMGSNTVIAINPDGSRAGGNDQIEVGKGPIGLALDEGRNRLYVWNHFDVSLTTINLNSHSVENTTKVFSPLPNSISKGRAHFYDTRATSGLGHVSCASCHVDGRSDRLAWDLGDPTGALKAFNQNCVTGNPQLNRVGCDFEFHPMKGPMLTQTLQDIIGKEPFHWRGDRDGLEEFNDAFETLQGDDEVLTAQEMQQFENFLATIQFPPNPFRNLDNSLSSNVNLEGHYSNGRFANPGSPLPNGNAKSGLTLFTDGKLMDLTTLQGPGAATNCSLCHGLPTGLAPNGEIVDAVNGDLSLGGRTLPTGPNGENHLGIVGISTAQNATIKVPSLRNLYERTGFESKRLESLAGFGFLHDGTIDSLAHFAELQAFLPESNQDVADLVAFMLSFSGSDLPTGNPSHKGSPVPSKDSHAGVGQQVTRTSSSAGGRLNTLVNIAASGRVDMVAHQPEGLRVKGWNSGNGQSFTPDDGSSPVNLNALLANASNQAPITFTLVPGGLGERLGVDRDGDGVFNGVEVAQYSNPADAASNQFNPEPGHWFNPGRSGHGMDLQRSGTSMVATWYTYNEDGTPHWYQAFGELQGMSWTGDLYQAVWVPAQGGIETETVGSMTMVFSSPQSAEFSWQIGAESGSETFTRFQFASGYTPQNYTGMWFDPNESGWGISIDSLADTRIALVFFYDGNNQPRWVLGSGANASGTEFDMLSFTGFCPWCTTTEAQPVAGGTMTLNFNGNRNAAVNMAVDYPAQAGSLFSKNTGVIPLTDEDVKPIDH